MLCSECGEVQRRHPISSTSAGTSWSRDEKHAGSTPGGPVIDNLTRVSGWGPTDVATARRSADWSDEFAPGCLIDKNRVVNQSRFTSGSFAKLFCRRNDPPLSGGLSDAAVGVVPVSSTENYASCRLSQPLWQACASPSALRADSDLRQNPEIKLP